MCLSLADSEHHKRWRVESTNLIGSLVLFGSRSQKRNLPKQQGYVLKDGRRVVDQQLGAPHRSEPLGSAVPRMTPLMARASRGQLLQDLGVRTHRQLDIHHFSYWFNGSKTSTCTNE